MIDPHHGWNVSYKPLFLGFVSSLILIFAAYRIADAHLTNTLLILTLFALVLIQAVLQLIFFLHLGLESKPRWNTMSFLFTVVVILVVFGGSLWIMHHLNYNLMPHMEH